MASIFSVITVVYKVNYFDIIWYNFKKLRHQNYGLNMKNKYQISVKLKLEIILEKLVPKRFFYNYSIPLIVFLKYSICLQDQN